jgi:hypothetical protein
MSKESTNTSPTTPIHIVESSVEKDDVSIAVFDNESQPSFSAASSSSCTSASVVTPARSKDDDSNECDPLKDLTKSKSRG